VAAANAAISHARQPQRRRNSTWYPVVHTPILCVCECVACGFVYVHLYAVCLALVLRSVTCVHAYQSFLVRECIWTILVSLRAPQDYKSIAREIAVYVCMKQATYVSLNPEYTSLQPLFKPWALFKGFTISSP